MPQLLVFVPCEKIIYDQESEEVSLINLLDTVTFTVPSGIEVPAATEIPLRWVVFTQWIQHQHEQGRIFEQRIELVNPQGAIHFESVAPLFQDSAFQRHVVRIAAFPIALAGDCAVRLVCEKAAALQAGSW